MAMEKTSKLLAVVVVLVMAAAMLVVVEGQSTNCTAALLTLQPCLPYLGAGNTSAPDASCCTPLNAAFNSSSASQCLCDNLSVLGLNITRAAELAISCNSTVPASVVSCVTAPSSAPSSPPPSSSPRSPAPPPAGSTPSTKTGGNSTSSSNQAGDGFAVWQTRNIVMLALVVGAGGMLV